MSAEGSSAAAAAALPHKRVVFHCFYVRRGTATAAAAVTQWPTGGTRRGMLLSVCLFDRKYDRLGWMMWDGKEVLARWSSVERRKGGRSVCPHSISGNVDWENGSFALSEMDANDLTLVALEVIF